MDAMKKALDEFYHSGRMMGVTKIGPEGHVCVWNANIFTAEQGKIWYGDLDLSDDRDRQRLMSLAADLGQRLYILKEMDGRFTRETNPAWDNAIACVTADSIEMHGATA